MRYTWSQRDWTMLLEHTSGTHRDLLMTWCIPSSFSCVVVVALAEAWVEAVDAASSVSSVVVLAVVVERPLQFGDFSWIQARSSH